MFQPAPTTTKRLPVATSTPRRYYIMGAASLPDGAAFAVTDSQQHLLAQFAMGHLSVKQVVDALTSQTAPALT